MSEKLKSYICSLDGVNWTHFNTTSRGRAKTAFRRELDMEVPYTAIKCRIDGDPFTDANFMNMAKYRGIEFAYCGMTVKVGDCKGIIVGHNSSANLDVLFTEGEWSGQVLNCHPHSEVTYYNGEGSVIKSFKREPQLATAP